MNPSTFLELAGRITDRLVQSPAVPVAPVNRPEVREAVREAIAADPVLKNELNAEKPSQSRVLWGNGIAAVGTIISGLIPVAQAFGFVTEEEGAAIVQGFGAIVALGGVAYSVYGRLASGLKPLFVAKA
jgi:uncharacterized membrane protein